jgi:hypothetical protein
LPGGIARVKLVYTAANLPDAWNIANLLGIEGIRARVLNAHAAGALGELPVDASRPQVWVERDPDEPRARSFIARCLAAATSTAVKPCGQCGEDNPVAFEVCWNCAAFLTPAP